MSPGPAGQPHHPLPPLPPQLALLASPEVTVLECYCEYCLSALVLYTYTSR